MAPETRANTKQVKGEPGAAFYCWLAVAATGFCALLFTLCAPQFFACTIKGGEPATVDIVCPRRAHVEDTKATEQAREAARQQVLQVFKRDQTVDRRILGRLDNLLNQSGSLQEKAGLPLPQSFALTPEEQSYLLESSDVVWQRIKANLGTRSPDRQNSRTSGIEGAESLRPGLEESIEAKLKRTKGADQATQAVAAIEKSRHAYQTSVSYGKRDILFLALSIPPSALPGTIKTVERATEKLLQLGPRFPDIAPADWERTMLEFLPDSWPDKVRFTCARIVSSQLEPNVVVDTTATKLKADSAAQAVKPVMRDFQPGQVVVARGNTVSLEMADTLNRLGITKSVDWPLVLSLTLSLMAGATFFGLYLHTYAPKHLYSPASIGLLFTVSIVTCGISASVGHMFPQFVPLPAAALVSTVFFGPRVAAALTLILLIFMRVDNLVDTNDLIALATGAAIAIGANIKQRHELMFRGFLIGVMQAAGFLCAAVITHSVASAPAVGQQLLLQILGGLSSCIVAIGSLPFLEDIFGMVTPFRVTELTASDQPLLRKLEENAPGTYQHSLAVANLAEAGARAIGGDVTLVRAGSLYHDIGKMVRPRYFIENQLGDTNPHDSMSPEESRDRVLAHVTDGLALAQKYGLPRVVQDFIPQHQGTTLMAYFYHKACLRDGAENVDAEFYRYSGPKPQSREAAIVMLADVSEAVTHSLSDPSQQEVEASIGTVFKARWDDGQMSESGLSREELEKVKKAFVRVWRTLHHERLKYPSTTTGRMAVAPDPPPRASKISQPTQKISE
jgi:putative nucleotidyltransferase with HDIG domain